MTQVETATAEYRAALAEVAALRRACALADQSANDARAALSNASLTCQVRQDAMLEAMLAEVEANG